MRCPSIRRIRRNDVVKLWGAFAVALLVAGCATTANRSEQGAAGGATENLPPVIEESLKNIGIASPRSLLAAETALGESTAGYTSYGLELSYVVYKMIQILYPLYLKPEYVIFPPTDSVYPELFRQVQSGSYPAVNAGDISFLTLIIPPMAALYTNSSDVLESSLDTLNHAQALNPSSVLPPYLKGVIAQKQGNGAIALSDYEQALSIAPSCYPAAVGAARILISEARYSRAAGLLEGLLPSLPPDAEVFRLYAEVQYRLGFYPEAEKTVSRTLELDPHSVAALMLSARIYEAEKQYAKALGELSKLEKPTSAAILLKARLEQEEGNLAAAIETLAAGMKDFPSDRELSDAYGKALISAGRSSAAGEYLPQNLSQSAGGAARLELLVADAIAAKNWKAGAAYVARLLEVRSDEKTFRQAYEIYRELGDREKALEFAHKLHEAAPEDPTFLVDYVRSLIASGRTKEARSAIDRGLAAGGSPQTLSALYFERSRIASDPTAELADLRSALLENLENEQALFAIARYYLRNGDLYSAQRYALEAEAFLPKGKKLPDDLAKLVAPKE